MTSINDPKNKDIANQDSGKKSADIVDENPDTLDENTGADTELAIKESTDESGDHPDSHKGLDGNDAPTSNKGQGPLGEDL